MPPITATLVNRPVWFDLSTSNLDAAKALYGELFGWTFVDSGPEMGHYTMAFANGQPAAAIAPKMPGQEAGPVVWSVYFGVTDADATAAAIVANGGSLMFPPMDVPGNGRMAIAIDPGGAAFGLWQAGGFPGARVEGEHGAMCWCEVASRHPDNAAFYEAVFGVSAHKLDVPGVSYWTMHLPGADNPADAVAGVMLMDEHWGDIAPHWLAYFAVANLDAATAVFKKHGGTILRGPIPSPYGKIMIGQDPQGAVMAYMSAT
jgi:predicted enzyme related to lactoylglutathione lyase